jgi:hypothetical protein
MSSILEMGIRLRRMVSFTPRPLYPLGKSLMYPFNRRLIGPIRGSLDAVEERKIAIQPVACRNTDSAIPAQNSP